MLGSGQARVTHAGSAFLHGSTKSGLRCTCLLGPALGYHDLERIPNAPECVVLLYKGGQHLADAFWESNVIDGSGHLGMSIIIHIISVMNHKQ